jgi:hypothetical protein
MIHVLTVHWQEDRWIKIQQEYFKRCFQEPYKVYAFINKINKDYSEYFEVCLRETVELKNVSESHSIKLNILAEIACNNADNNDHLVFIDGDAFPVIDIMPEVKETLKKYPLMAVRRDENNGDRQPHPSFAVTTVGFWKEIKGDWKPGYKWKNGNNQVVTDTGGNLLKILEDREVEWFPMLRTNKVNLHPLWFGIYSDLAYHHGAGFRTPLSRADERLLAQHFPTIRFLQSLADHESRWIRIFGKALKFFYPKRKWNRELKMVGEKNMRISNDILEKMKIDINFWKVFVEGA